MRLRSKAAAEAAAVAKAADVIAAAAAAVSAAAAVASAEASASEFERISKFYKEASKTRAAKEALDAIESAVNHNERITAIRVQECLSLSLDERMNMIYLQLMSGRYERYLMQSVELSREEVAKSVAASAASFAEKDDSAIIHIIFMPLVFVCSRLIVTRYIEMKVIVDVNKRSRSTQISYAAEGVRRITSIRLDFPLSMPQDQRIDMILYELARFEMNIMVAELNVLLTTVASSKPHPKKDNAINAVNVMVAELNTFLQTVTSNPTVILRLTTAALRRVVLSHEMHCGKETLFRELSEFEVSSQKFDDHCMELSRQFYS